MNNCGTFCRWQKDFIKMVVLETVCQSASVLLIHRKRSPFPAGEGFTEPTRSLCFKVFDQNFFQKVLRGCVGQSPTDTAFLFWSFFLWPFASKKKAAKCTRLIRENEMMNDIRTSFA